MPSPNKLVTSTLFSNNIDDGGGGHLLLSGNHLAARHRYLPWKRYHSIHLIALFFPRNRNRAVLSLLVYLLLLSFFSYLLFATFSPCVTCLWQGDQNNNDQQKVIAGIEDRDVLNLVLEQLRKRVVKIANISDESHHHHHLDDDDDDSSSISALNNNKIINEQDETFEPIIITAPKLHDVDEEETITTTTTTTTTTTEATTQPVRIRFDAKVENVISALQSIIDRPFTNDAEEFEKASLHFYGMQTRLEHTLMKLFFLDEDDPAYQNRKLKVAAVGGSITVGNGIPRNLGYFNHVVKWLREPLKHRGIELSFANAAIGASGSEYFSMCIDEYFNLTEVDILLVEFAFNDGRYVFYMSGYQPDGARPLEELIRSVWRANPMIHIILINFPFIKNIFRLYYPPKCDSIEDELYLKVTQHYQLTSIRWKHMFCNGNVTMTREDQKNLAEIYVASDGNHPSSLVHLQMSEFLVFYLRTALRRLIERLQIARGASTVNAMMIADRLTIEEHTSRLIYSTDTVYKTTWVDASDCFASFDRPFRRNTRLVDAVVNSSSDVSFENVFTITTYEKDGAIYGDNLQLFILEKKPSFLNFRLTNFRTTSPCRGNVGFEPRIAIAYTLCKDCSPGELRISATFVLANGSVFNATFPVKLKSHGFKTNYVHLLPTLPQWTTQQWWPDRNVTNSKFCKNNEQPFIATVQLQIEQLSLKYPLVLHAIVINYDCCQQQQKALHQFSNF